MRVLVGHDGSSYADAAIEDLKRAGLPERVEEGHTQEALLAEARRFEADCIVIGSGFAAIAANAECSVEIVRQALERRE